MTYSPSYRVCRTAVNRSEAAGPPSRQGSLLAEAGFVLEVHFYSFAGVLDGDLFQCFREVF